MRMMEIVMIGNKIGFFLFPFNINLGIVLVVGDMFILNNEIIIWSYNAFWVFTRSCHEYLVEFISGEILDIDIFKFFWMSKLLKF